MRTGNTKTPKSVWDGGYVEGIVGNVVGGLQKVFDEIFVEFVELLGGITDPIGVVRVGRRRGEDVRTQQVVDGIRYGEAVHDGLRLDVGELQYCVRIRFELGNRVLDELLGKLWLSERVSEKSGSHGEFGRSGVGGSQETKSLCECCRCLWCKGRYG